MLFSYYVMRSVWHKGKLKPALIKTSRTAGSTTGFVAHTTDQIKPVWLHSQVRLRPAVAGVLLCTYHRRLPAEHFSSLWNVHIIIKTKPWHLYMIIYTVHISIERIYWAKSFTYWVNIEGESMSSCFSLNGEGNQSVLKWFTLRRLWLCSKLWCQYKIYHQHQNKWSYIPLDPF